MSGKQTCPGCGAEMTAREDCGCIAFDCGRVMTCEDEVCRSVWGICEDTTQCFSNQLSTLRGLVRAYIKAEKAADDCMEYHRDAIDARYHAARAALEEAVRG